MESVAGSSDLGVPFEPLLASLQGQSHVKKKVSDSIRGEMKEGKMPPQKEDVAQG